MKQSQSQSALDAILRIASNYFQMPIKLDALSNDAFCNAWEFIEALYWHCKNSSDGVNSLEHWVVSTLDSTLKMNLGSDGAEPDNLFTTLYGDCTMSYFVHETFHQLGNIQYQHKIGQLV